MSQRLFHNGSIKRNISLGEQFSTYGTTFQYQFFGSTKICTIVPQNLQSVFSNDFGSWGIAPLRQFFFGPFIGKGIMTADGPFWAHSRALLKPTFSRAQISDLSAYSIHVDNLLAVLSEHDALDVDLKPYFEKLALDSSTEFLFGHSTGSLTPSPALDAQAFLKAYNYGQAGIGKRMQLPQWNFLTRDTRFWSSCSIARAFVEGCVMQASAAEKNLSDKQPAKLVLAHQLAAQTKDHKDIVNQLLNVFLPAHDATAVALTNIFFHLSRHPRVYAALRREIGALGPSSTWTFERLKACKYLQAVINETFRLNPSIGQMNRIALRDTMLPVGGGRNGAAPVFVKKGTVLTTSFYALHRLSGLWGQDSGVWRPERWLSDEGDRLIKVEHDFSAFRRWTQGLYRYAAGSHGSWVCCGKGG
ncbi:cytochrome P450 monooxygenase [Physcia stellaris]|nr:cytochrome P450 monooxygenase [Physcia stellaris]